MNRAHRHRWLPDRPSQVIPGAVVERCTKDNCGAVRIKPPDAAIAAGHPSGENDRSPHRSAAIGTAGARPSGKSGGPRRSNNHQVNGPGTTPTRSTSAQEAPA